MKQADDLKENENDLVNSKLMMEKYDVVLKGEQEDVDKFTLTLQEVVFDYFNLIVKEYYMGLDKWSQDVEYTNEIKAAYMKIDKELDDEEMEGELPEGLTKQMAEQLLSEKEKLLSNIYTQLMKMQQAEGAGGKFDFEQTVLLNRTMFDDKMYLKTGFQGRDLQKAIMKFGIYDERMAEAK